MSWQHRLGCLLSFALAAAAKEECGAAKGSSMLAWTASLRKTSVQEVEPSLVRTGTGRGIGTSSEKELGDSEASLCDLSFKPHPGNASATVVKSVNCRRAAEAASTDDGRSVPFHFVWATPPGRQCSLGALQQCSLEAAGREGHAVNLWLVGGDGRSLECEGSLEGVRVRRFDPQPGNGFAEWLAANSSQKLLEGIDSLHLTDLWRLAILAQEPGVYADLDLVVASPSFFAQQAEFVSFWFGTPRPGDAGSEDVFNNALLKFDANSTTLAALLEEWHRSAERRLSVLKAGKGYGIIGPGLLSAALQARSRRGLPIPSVFPKKLVFPAICEDFGSPVASLHATEQCGAVGGRVGSCAEGFLKGACPGVLASSGAAEQLFFPPGSEQERRAAERKEGWTPDGKRLWQKAARM